MTIKNIFFRGHNCLNVSFTNTSKNEASDKYAKIIEKNADRF